MTDIPSEVRKVEEQGFRLRKDLVQPEAIQLIPEAMARKYNVMPLEVKGNVLRVAMANPADIRALEALEAQSRMRIESQAASAEEIQETIDFCYQSYEEVAKQIATISLPGESETTIEEIVSDTVADAPIAKALTVIIDGAIKARASDIHIQPEEDDLRVRYRIDGTLHDTLSLPLQTSVPLISRLKISPISWLNLIFGCTSMLLTIKSKGSLFLMKEAKSITLISLD